MEKEDSDNEYYADASKDENLGLANVRATRRISFSSISGLLARPSAITAKFSIGQVDISFEISA